MKINATFTAAAAAVVALALGAPRPAMAEGRKPSDVILLGPQAAFLRAVDGDTIEVNLNGETITVRLIGTDAPALNACYGAAARNALNALLRGESVILQRDISDADASGELFPRYVYLRDGRMANEEMISGGYARAAATQPDTSKLQSLSDLEAAARAARRGGWSACGWKSTVAKPPGQCTTISAADLMVRTSRLPVLNTLRDGDCVTIVKPKNDYGEAWGGQFIYHPKGSSVTPNQGYVRWRDGFVLLQRDPANPGQLLGSVDFDTVGPPIVIEYEGQRYRLPGKVEHFGAMQPLERDPGNAQIVRLPTIGTWLFQDQGNGKFTNLVDFFEYKSGDLRVPRLADNSQLY